MSNIWEDREHGFESREAFVRDQALAHLIHTSGGVKEAGEIIKAEGFHAATNRMLSELHALGDAAPYYKFPENPAIEPEESLKHRLDFIAEHSEPVVEEAARKQFATRISKMASNMQGALFNIHDPVDRYLMLHPRALDPKPAFAVPDADKLAAAEEGFAVGAGRQAIAPRAPTAPVSIKPEDIEIDDAAPHVARGR